MSSNHRSFVSGLLWFFSVSSLPPPAAIAATEPCSAPGVGWCLVRRIAGDAPNGELGFRFGEPLDIDGDGHADIAAGARFKREGNVRKGTAAVWSGATGAQIRTWAGEYPNGLFGHWILPVPDLSGDGLADVIIAAPNTVVEGIGCGVLVARSPKTGKEIWKHVGGSKTSFGWDMAPAGDHDGDGRIDLFVGAPAGDAGRAYLLSGKDGKVLRTYAPPKDVPTFGWYVAPLNDIDADGVADLAISAFQETDAAGTPVGGAYVVSGRNAKELHHWTGPDGGSSFGDIVAAVADVDGDGLGDLAISAPRTSDPTRTRPGEVHIYSTATGKLLRTWAGSQPGELFGRMVVSTGDLDGDGVDDIAVSAPWHARQGSERVGRVELRSGKSGDVLIELFGDAADCWFGWHIRRAPDPDGHGRPALLISSLRHPVDGHAGVGVLDLYVLRRKGAN